MSAVLDQLSSTVVWLCVFAPMLSLGVIMAVDPHGFYSLLGNFAEVLRRFEYQLHARWHEPLLPLMRGRVSPVSDVPVRLVGAILVTLSLLGLWDALR
jgi:hypothetical protein